MIGAIITMAAAVTIVFTYITIVHWFLRQDEHYDDGLAPALMCPAELNVKTSPVPVAV